MKRAEKNILPGYESVGYIELLRNNRSFRQLWLGQVVSQMGDWFDTIALYTIILNLTGSGRDVGLLLVARFVPSFLFGPLSGVVADRFSRQKIMIVTDILRAVVVLGFLFVRSADQLWIVYVLTVVQLGLSTFFEPAKTAAIPSIVSDRELVPANAISSVTWSVMLTLGAAIGGLITGWFGTDVAFILDAATYLLSAALIASIRVKKRRKRERQKLSFGRALGITETIDGIKYVKDRPRVLALLLVKPAWGIGGGILTLLAVFGERIFPVGSSPATGIGVSVCRARHRHGGGTNRRAPHGRRRTATHADVDRDRVPDWRPLLHVVRHVDQFRACVDHAGNRALRRQYPVGLLDGNAATRGRGQLSRPRVCRGVGAADVNYGSIKLRDRRAARSLWCVAAVGNGRHRSFLLLARHRLVRDSALVGSRNNRAGARKQTRRAPGQACHSSIDRVRLAGRPRRATPTKLAALDIVATLWVRI